MHSTAWLIATELKVVVSHSPSTSEALKHRQVIPRWLSPREAAEHESAPADPARPTHASSSKHWMEIVRENFRRAPSAHTATELVETAFALGLDAHSEIRGFKSLHEVALSATSGHPAAFGVSSGNQGEQLAEINATARREIHNLKSRASAYPRQPFVWSELARHYLSLGHYHKATTAMTCARALAPRSVYLARSAARLYTQIDEPEHALEILRNNSKTSTNPWLLSAEVAISSKADLPSKLVKKAVEMLGEKGHSPRNLTELAAAVGTLEHLNGKHKRAKLLFAQCLLDPTANALAQAQWASEQDHKIQIPVKAWESETSFEARALAARLQRNWSESQAMAIRWLRDEPFDFRASTLGSYYSFVPDLTGLAVEIATTGLVAAKGNPLLLNNRAVAKAFLGDLDGAFSDLSQAIRSDSSDPHYIATLGLIAYRGGNAALGSELYAEAAAWFAGKKDKFSTTMASLHWIREEARMGSVGVADELEAMKKLVIRWHNPETAPEIFGLLDLIEFEISNYTACPIRAGLVPSVIPADELKGLSRAFQVPSAARQLARRSIELREKPIAQADWRK